MQRTEMLEKLVAQVQMKRRYQNISEELVRWIGEKELAKRRNLKAAVKATRSKLHQVGGAYQREKINYAEWQEELHQLEGIIEDPNLQAFCLRMMEQHTSTRERLSFMEEFYSETLASLAPIHSVLDVGCGLNPLAIPWLPLAEDFAYFGYDIYEDMVDFLNQYFSHLKIQGAATVHNLVQNVGEQFHKTQVALLLKTIPCLEQLDKSIGARLLENIPAEHILVSFPARSLGGRRVGMDVYYESHFLNMVSGKNWRIERFEFTNELAFLIHR
jgi:16S rRNA (guanine(1405)-N(7))-methyltransferase